MHINEDMVRVSAGTQVSALLMIRYRLCPALSLRSEGHGQTLLGRPLTLHESFDYYDGNNLRSNSQHNMKEPLGISSPDLGTAVYHILGLVRAAWSFAGCTQDSSGGFVHVDPIVKIAAPITSSKNQKEGVHALMTVSTSTQLGSSSRPTFCLHLLKQIYNRARPVTHGGTARGRGGC